MIVVVAIINKEKKYECVAQRYNSAETAAFCVMGGDGAILSMCVKKRCANAESIQNQESQCNKAQSTV